MGPNRYGYLFRRWLPARALPLLARAAFAIEVTRVSQMGERWQQLQEE